MVVFGGFTEVGRSNNVWIFDTDESTWTLREHKDPKMTPCPRTGHGAVVIEDDMWVFGGHADEGEKEKLNDVWRYNIPSNTWEQVTGIDDKDLPQERSGHAMAVYKHFFIIHGGIFEITKELDDTYLFNTQTKKFIYSGETEHKSPVASPSRSREMYGKGGASPVRARSPNKRDTLRVGQSSPSRKVGLSPVKGPLKHSHKKKKKLAAKKEAKEDDALNSPTSVSMKNSFIIKNADPSFDSYYYQMKKRKHNLDSSENPGYTYSNNRIQGKKPPARDGHTGVIFGDDYVVFGGDRHHMPYNDIYTLDLPSLIRERAE